MRTSFTQLVRRGSRRLVALPYIAVALLAAGCSGDSTDPPADGLLPDDEGSFEIGPSALATAQTAQMGQMHRLAIADERGARKLPFAASSAKPVDSPFDLTYFGGPVLTRSRSHNVYVNCADPASCWGTGPLTPGTFLSDLNQSQFIRVVNEFIHVDARGRFPVSELKTRATFANHTATLGDIFSILAGAVERTGKSGYEHVYHVFLPEGTDMCIDEQTCYSPDDPSRWIFCAFHGPVDFGSTHVLFSVEPYQFVDGCAFPGQTPHGVIDATASTLSHELLESVTDPDLNAWFNVLFGLENADICFAFATNQRMGKNEYVVQSEYSNKAHGCVSAMPT